MSGCLLDFLKTDEGKKLKVNKLIDMAAQVRAAGKFLQRHSRSQHFCLKKKKKKALLLSETLPGTLGDLKVHSFTQTPVV